MYLNRKNISGFSIIEAMLVTTVIAFVCLLISSYSIEINKASKLPRIKSSLLNAEIELKRLLLKPSTYSCVLAAGILTCSFSPAAISPGGDIQKYFENTITKNFSQSICSSFPCIHLKPSLDAANNPIPYLQGTVGAQSFNGTIYYTGAEKIRDVIISNFTISNEVLLLSFTDVKCAYPKILFSGFDNSGNIICRELPGQSGMNPPTCITGNTTSFGYISFIDRKTLALNCKTMVSGELLIDCGTNYISGFTFQSDKTVTNVTCEPRASVFNYYTYDPLANLVVSP